MSAGLARSETVRVRCHSNRVGPHADGVGVRATVCPLLGRFSLEHVNGTVDISKVFNRINNLEYIELYIHIVDFVFKSDPLDVNLLSYFSNKGQTGVGGYC